MKNYTPNETLPSAHIAISNNRLTEHYTGTSETVVYLNKNDEFQIELINPTSDEVCAEIHINGEYLGKGLVIPAKSNYFLDRHLLNDNKLLFDVFDVENNGEVKEIIKENGNVCINFYKKKAEYAYYYNPWLKYNDNPFEIYRVTSGTGNLNNINNTWTTTPNCSITALGGVISGWEINNDYLTTNIGLNSGYVNSCYYSNTTQDTIQTGRIEQGSKSTQTFSTSASTFEVLPMCTTNIKLLPIPTTTFSISSDNITTTAKIKLDPDKTYINDSSTLTDYINERINESKNISTKTIRTYCRCGRRIKKGWIYCPGCGYKI